MIDPFWTALVFGLPTVLTSGAAAYISIQNQRELRRQGAVQQAQGAKQDQLHVQINGKMAALLAATKAEAQGVGRAEGIEGERLRQEQK